MKKREKTLFWGNLKSFFSPVFSLPSLCYLSCFCFSLSLLYVVSLLFLFPLFLCLLPLCYSFSPPLLYFLFDKLSLLLVVYQIVASFFFHHHLLILQSSSFSLAFSCWTIIIINHLLLHEPSLVSSSSSPHKINHCGCSNYLTFWFTWLGLLVFICFGLHIQCLCFFADSTN